MLGFYRYAITRGYVAASPLPVVLPQRPPPFVPYIYTHDEIRRLVRATDCYRRRRSRLEPITIRTVVLLFYGAGLRLHEALALNRDDVDLAKIPCSRSATTKFFKTRLVPFSPQLGGVLAEYTSAAARHHPESRSRGSVLHHARWHPSEPRTPWMNSFRRVCEDSGVRRRPARATSRGCTTCVTPSRSTG